MMETIVDTLLELLTGEDFSMLPKIYESPYRFLKRYKNYEKYKYDKVVNHMVKRGVVEVFKKDNQKFVRCTRKGQLEILLKKSLLINKTKWDGKFRLFFYDIPEESHKKRDQLRFILKKYGFKKLQGSVFISPYPLNNKALKYLKETDLIEYIRIMRVDKADDDKDLRKKFNLK